MDPRDDQRRQADLDWLYGTERPAADRTRVMDAGEQAELARRRAQAATTGARAARTAAPDSRPGAAKPTGRASRIVPAPGRASGTAAAADKPSRVVHREGDLPPASPRPTNPRPAAPKPGHRPSAHTVAEPLAERIAPALRRGRSATAAPRPADTGRSRRPRLAGRPHWLRWLLLALVAWVVWLLVVPVVGLSRSPQVREQPSGERPGQQPGTLTLLVGSDKRTGLTPEQQAELHTGGNAIEGERTDTMMLLFQPRNGKPVLVSLPRDTYAKIPGHGHNKLNAAYSLGGPQLLVSTVEGLTGLRVDNYLEVGFDGFANVVDSLGGIRMCLDKPMVDEKSHTNLPAGCQKLGGTKALGYVRMRYADPSGDLGRVKRQRAMIAAIADKAASPMTFIDPVRYWRLNMAAGKGLTRGEDTSVTELPGIARAFVSVSGGSGQSLTVPVSDPGAMSGGVSYVKWDEEKAADMFGRMAQGDTTGLEQYAK